MANQRAGQDGLLASANPDLPSQQPRARQTWPMMDGLATNIWKPIGRLKSLVALIDPGIAVFVQEKRQKVLLHHPGSRENGTSCCEIAIIILKRVF